MYAHCLEEYLLLGFPALQLGFSLSEEQQRRAAVQESLLGCSLAQSGCTRAGKAAVKSQGHVGSNSSNPTPILAGSAAPAKGWRGFCGVCPCTTHHPALGTLGDIHCGSSESFKAHTALLPSLTQRLLLQPELDGGEEDANQFNSEWSKAAALQTSLSCCCLHCSLCACSSGHSSRVGTCSRYESFAPNEQLQPKDYL